MVGDYGIIINNDGNTLATVKNRQIKYLENKKEYITWDDLIKVNEEKVSDVYIQLPNNRIFYGKTPDDAIACSSGKEAKCTMKGFVNIVDQPSNKNGQQIQPVSRITYKAEE